MVEQRRTYSPVLDGYPGREESLEAAEEDARESCCGNGGCKGLRDNGSCESSCEGFKDAVAEIMSDMVDMEENQA